MKGCSSRSIRKRRRRRRSSITRGKGKGKGKDFYQVGLEEMRDTRLINGTRWTRDDKRGWNELQYILLKAIVI